MRRIMARLDDKRVVPPLPDGVIAYSDIAYGEAAEQRLDVYVPLARTNLPVIADVHGGAFIYGDKELNKRFCYALARLGFAVVSINYRLVPDVTAERQIGDVISSLRWTAENIRDYGGNADEAYICGDSAGAFLSLMAAAACGSPKIAEIFGGAPLRIRGCFFISGLYNIHSGCLVKSLRNFGVKAERKKYKYTHLDELFGEWSPPPCFLASSRGDFLRRQTSDFAKMLTERNLSYALDFKEFGEHKYSHIYLVKNPEWRESEEVIKRAVRFLTERRSERSASKEGYGNDRI